jgi:hypothetical protein
MSESENKPLRGRGRPKKQDMPNIDYNELDKLLVFGEVVPVPAENGGGTNVVFPSYRDLAERFGVVVSTIGDYAKKHDCLKRRERAKLRTQARVEEKLVERRAEAIAVSKEEEIEIIDSYLAGFKTALSEGRVRYDSPADYNTMARLKEFLLGGADSRQETHGVLSLEQLQVRHRQAQQMMEGASPAERGAVTALPAAEQGVGEAQGAAEAGDAPAEDTSGASGEAAGADDPER